MVTDSAEPSRGQLRHCRLALIARDPIGYPLLGTFLLHIMSYLSPLRFPAAQVCLSYTPDM